MPIPTGDTPLSDYLLWPVMALLLVGVLTMVLKWSHAPTKRSSGPSRHPQVGGHGLLVPVTTVRDPIKARHMVSVLAEVGIRATIAGGPQEQLLLVWPQQAEAARDRLARAMREDG